MYIWDDHGQWELSRLQVLTVSDILLISSRIWNDKVDLLPIPDINDL